MKVLVTGSAGFIGFHLARRLLARGDEVIGLDAITPYYDPKLKEARLDQIKQYSNFSEARIDLCDKPSLTKLFDQHRPSHVVNLAAQAGVRYSLEQPQSYIDSNITGFLNILEECRNHEIEHLVYASSSSVYGANRQMPFSTRRATDHPVSIYAATKKSNELMAHSYSHLFGFPSTGLRFFTVYGPWGRPDMALFLFTKAILEGRPIDVFNHGDMRRDFTYIDDIIEGILRVMERPPSPVSCASDEESDLSTSHVAPHRVFNIGNDNPIELLHFIETLERKIGIQAEKNLLPMQPGDVPATWADVSDLEKEVGYRPNTSVETGVSRFVDWYREYYGV